MSIGTNVNILCALFWVSFVASICGVGALNLVNEANTVISSQTITTAVSVVNPLGSLLFKDSTFTSSVTIEMDAAWYADISNTQVLKIEFKNCIFDGPVVIRRFRMTGSGSPILVQDSTLLDTTQSLLVQDVSMTSSLGLKLISNTKLGNTTIDRFAFASGIISLTSNGAVDGSIRMKDSTVTNSLIMVAANNIAALGNNVDPIVSLLFDAATFTDSVVRIVDNTIQSRHPDPAYLGTAHASLFQECNG